LNRRLSLLTLVLAAAVAQASANPVSASSQASGPSSGLGPTEVAVVVNIADRLSLATGAYYARVRHIPDANIVKVRFDPGRDDIPPATFAALKESVDRRLRPQVQAFVLTWVRPYRVGCMSVTSAFAFGVDEKLCASGCQQTRANPYYNSPAAKPYDQFHFRPAMSLAASNWSNAKALIDRGVRSDGSAPQGTAYLVRTSDEERNVRASEYALADRVAAHEFAFRVITGSAPQEPRDAMFYFTGSATVADIGQVRFLPGAVADHLTSFGGMLTDSPQMTSLRWLEAGATGSYGTVVEPCNFLGKFPNVPVLLAHYLAGETLIEAYWKSVAMPGQGIFIGDPLAAPFRIRTTAGHGR
jgi:uncharacterized protein (TIGR03790 family)